MKLWDYIREKMMKKPGQTIGEGKTSMTYEEVVIFVDFLSKKLTGEASCAIYCRSEMAAAISLLACFAAGITAIPLSSRYGAVHCNKILRSISPSCVITDMEGGLGIYQITDSTYCTPDVHPALIMCTSGTTGAPKGVMLTEENVLTNLRDICEYFRMGELDTILIGRPLYHCAVLTGEFLTSLVKGAKIVFYSGAFNPTIILRLIESNDVTVFCTTPTLLNLLSKFVLGKKKTPLKRIVISGECMHESVGKQIRDAFPEAEIYHVYGLTEACPRVSYMPPHYFDKAPDHVGLPLSSIQIEIRDKNGRPTPINVDGILWIRGENVMAGYYNAPEQTHRVLQNGWLCTGDIACQNERGWLKIKGRADDLIIRAGMNIYPQEIEAELKKDHRTKEVMVYGYEDSRLGTQIGIMIAGEYRDQAEVRTLCAQVLPAFQMPTKIEILEELPKNGSGKIIRRRSHAGV